MATSTYKSFLMYKATSSATAYTKLVDIIDYPDMGGEPEQLDTTTLSDEMKTSILGIQENENKTFTANYDPTVYQTLKGMEGEEHDFALWFGGTGSGSNVTPVGDLGQFSFKGQLSVYVAGKGVNEVRQMTITIAPSTVIDFSVAS